jgi:hypothetical protein
MYSCHLSCYNNCCSRVLALRSNILSPATQFPGPSTCCIHHLLNTTSCQPVGCSSMNLTINCQDTTRLAVAPQHGVLGDTWASWETDGAAFGQQALLLAGWQGMPTAQGADVETADPRRPHGAPHMRKMPRCPDPAFGGMDTVGRVSA